jgi:DNA invertase Pin-like site-specific DNA recombinase
MLTVLGGFAEFERELIRARTDDGTSSATSKPVRSHWQEYCHRPEGNEI